jgi:PAS domain S-box-containing protein
MSNPDPEPPSRRQRELEAENERLRRQLRRAGLDAPRSVEAEDRLPVLLDSATDYAILTTDAGGLVTSWNEGAWRLLGWHEDEMLGRDIRIIFTPEDRDAGVPEREREQASNAGRAEDERWHVRKDGSRFWASGIAMPLRDGAGGFLKILRDRTEHLHAERKPDPPPRPAQGPGGGRPRHHGGAGPARDPWGHHGSRPHHHRRPSGGVQHDPRPGLVAGHQRGRALRQVRGLDVLREHAGRLGHLCLGLRGQPHDPDDAERTRGPPALARLRGARPRAPAHAELARDRAHGLGRTQPRPDPALRQGRGRVRRGGRVHHRPARPVRGLRDRARHGGRGAPPRRGGPAAAQRDPGGAGSRRAPPSATASGP